MALQNKLMGIDMTTKIELDGGKYTYVLDGGKQYALRHGEQWRDLTGDNLVYWMGSRIEDLGEINSGLVKALRLAKDRASDRLSITELHFIDTLLVEAEAK